MKLARALLGAAVLIFCMGCAVTPDQPKDPARALVFVTPTFVVETVVSSKGTRVVETGGGVSAVDVASPTLEVVWTRSPRVDRALLLPDRALQVAFDRAHGLVWVGDLDGPGLVALVARTGEDAFRIPLPHEVVGIALSPDGKHLVTAARDALEAYVIDSEKGTLLATIPTGTLEPTDPRPSFFTAHPAFLGNSHALVQDNVHGALVRLDLARLAADARFEIGSPVHAIDRSREGDRLLALVEGVAGKVKPRVLVLDPSTGEPGTSVVIPLDADETPRLHHGTFSADGLRYYVANMGPLKPPANGKPGHTITELSLGDSKQPLLVQDARAGAGAGHPILSPDEARLYVVNHHETYVSVFETDPHVSLRPLPPLELAHEKGFGHGVVFHEGALLVLCSKDGDLVRVAPDGTVTRRALGAELGELEPGW